MLTHLVLYLLVLSKIDDHSLQDVKSESTWHITQDPRSPHSCLGPGAPLSLIVLSVWSPEALRT